MSDIFPEEICYSILLRVPAEPLLRFRSVCKPWRRIIDDTSFVKTHVKLHHQQMYGDHLVIRNDTGGKLYSLPLSSLDFCITKSKTVTLRNIKNLVGLGVPKIKKLPVPTHSGMILITENSRDGKNKTWMMWNPFTGDSFVLPLHAHLQNGIDSIEYIPRNGIGYDYVGDDFKVVRILQLWGPELSCMLETLVYSLKSNTWKRIVNFHDCRQPRPGRTNGVFVNGALHWSVDVVKQRKWSERIIAFDLSNEEGRVLPFPSFILQKQCISDFHLDVFGGFLCLRNCRGVWIMEDYGVNVWTKVLSYEQLRVMGKPIAYIKSRGQILFQHGNEFVMFDVEKKCGKKFSFEGLPKDFTSQVFPSSLFRLNRSGDGGHDGSIALEKTLKRKRSTANNRLKVQLKVSDVDDPPSSSSENSAPCHGGFCFS